MKENLRGDSLATVIGLLAFVALFVFAIYLPGLHACARLEQQIARAQNSLEKFPKRAQQLQSMRAKVEQRTRYLQNHAQVIAEYGNQHEIIGQVARLAEGRDLTLTRLEPLEPVVHHSYRALPFRLNFQGTFRGIADFLRSLEDRRRLFAVRELNLTAEPASGRSQIKGDLRFEVYVSRRESNDSEENRESSPLLSADLQRR